ncbi:hypothetical protein N7G274_006920 [Stereocaulon virgatum]|uniref:Uncharacterized protein n=1 Tax=Stereocaulon virgatum TaxID=373712 RepID=A0ABR4A3H3_9LECA
MPVRVDHSQESPESLVPVRSYASIQTVVPVRNVEHEDSEPVRRHSSDDNAYTTIVHEDLFVSNPDSPEPPLPRVREPRHLDRLPRTGLHTSFEVPAVLSLMRSHPNLYQEMVENENKIEQAFEDRLFKNWPVCKFFRRQDEKVKKASGKLEERLIKLAQEMITRAQDFVDRKRDALDTRNGVPLPDGTNNVVNFVQTRVATRKAKCSNLYALASKTSSTDMLHARRARNVSLSKNRDDTETAPTSVDVVHVVPHEAQLALRRVRAISNMSDDTLAALVESRSLSSDAPYALRRYLTKCMRNPTRCSDEFTLQTPSLASLASTYELSLSSGDCKRKRFLSISYANGNTEIEEPVVECEGERRPSIVAVKWGKDLDDIIPGKAWIV